MAERVLIFGKDTWPYTTAAREEYGKRKIPFQYINVTKDPAGMKQMLQHSKGGRTVPVIVDGGKVTIGFDGGGWEV